MSGAMDETGFRLYRRAIYTLFYALVSALTLLRASPQRRGFSSIMPDVTITVGVCQGRFYIRRFYYIFVNRLSGFHMIKRVNRLLKGNRLIIKDLYICLLRPTVRHTFQRYFI